MSTTEQRGWSVDAFEAFWSKPDPSLVPGALTEDVVGYWTGRAEPVRGREEYTRCIADLVEALPDVRLEVAEQAEAASSPSSAGSCVPPVGTVRSSSAASTACASVARSWRRT
jgi:SnoaL-like polyketide cyclase